MVGNGAPQPGDVLGNYVLKRLLGTGGMGLVYLAEHERLKRKVALKLLRPELTTDPVSVRRFFAEARAVNEIGHDNIVEVTDFVDVGDHRYFVMELLKGHSLGEVIAQGPMPLPRALHVARQIADALHGAHEAGVWHRDLKPQNIFLIKRGTDADFVKVLDFGIAKVRGMDIDVEQTAAGTFVGTPAYMAPEQLANKPCDHRVDVYSFGILFFEIVTGLRPFRGNSMAELIVQQLTVLPPKPSAVLREAGGTALIPDKLERFLLALLEKDPTKRVQSMSDVLNVIDDLIQLVGPTLATGSLPPQQRMVDTTGDYALPSASGWVAVNKNNMGLTTSEGAAPDEPEFADLDDVVDASADAVPVDAASSSVAASSVAASGVAASNAPAAGSAASRVAAPISFAPLPPLPPLQPMASLPSFVKPSFSSSSASPSASGSSSATSAVAGTAIAGSSKLDDASKPILVGRPITESALTSTAATGNGNGSGNVAVNTDNAFGANKAFGTHNGFAGDDVSGPNATSIDGVVPAMVPRPETSPTMAMFDTSLGAEAVPPGTANRGKMMIVAVVAVVAVVAILAVAFGTGDDATETVADPTNPVVAPNVAPTTPNPVAIAAPVDPSTDPPIKPPGDAPTDPPTDQPTDMATGDVAPIPGDEVVVAPKKAVRVEVSFTSKPAGASVVVGGRTLGATPLTTKVVESSRAVAVAFKLDGYESKTVSARLIAGATVNAALVELKKDEPAVTAKDGGLINPFKKKPK